MLYRLIWKFLSFASARSFLLAEVGWPFVKKRREVIVFGFQKKKMLCFTHSLLASYPEHIALTTFEIFCSVRWSGGNWEPILDIGVRISNLEVGSHSWNVGTQEMFVKEEIFKKNLSKNGSEHMKILPLNIPYIIRLSIKGYLFVFYPRNKI